MKTLRKLNQQCEKLREHIAKGECITGTFGLNACKESVKWDLAHGLTIEEVYTKQVTLCLTRPLHNEMMIIACEEIMKEIEQ